MTATTPDAVAPTLSIAEIASGNDSFDILVAALDAAGLVQTFLDPGDFTVFAPTDDAFRTLATETLGLDITGLDDAAVAGALVGALDTQTLTNVLLYHVRPGAASVAELQDAGSTDTLLAGAGLDVAGDVLVDLDPGVKNPAFIDGLTDIAATNGTIQAIDRVLLPIDLAEAVTLPTIAEIATGSTEFEALVAALTATGLVDLFTDPDAAFTVFAPTDDAFRGLAEAIGLDTTGVADADLAGALVGALGADLVTDVLLYHVRAGEASVAELQADRVSDTALDGAILAFDGDTIVDADPGVADPAFIDGLTDIEALNGTVQAIDGVLLPADLLDSARVVARGSRDDDVLRGGAGDDRLGGRSGEDVLIGGEGGDRLFGRSGDDLLFGEAGNDILRGGFGDDHLVAGAGNDFLSGGRGADSFDFSDLEGENTIWRFDRKDTLILSAEEFESAEAVLEDATVFARSVLIEGENGSILVQRAFGLDEGDILLV